LSTRDPDRRPGVIRENQRPFTADALLRPESRPNLHPKHRVVNLQLQRPIASVTFIVNGQPRSGEMCIAVGGNRRSGIKDEANPDGVE
jgi:hypothetical protein